MAFRRAVLLLVALSVGFGARASGPYHTEVSIVDGQWWINGAPTNAGSPAEGLLLNARMVQATFEDANPDTVALWSYPDGTPFDATRQTDEFIGMIPVYADWGLDAVTLSLQGGRPMGGDQVWINSAFERDGGLRLEYMSRVARLIEALDAHGMVAILTYFYFGQTDLFDSEEAIVAATVNASDWVLTQGYTNVLIEIVNEAGHSDYAAWDILYRPGGVRGGRVHELIAMARAIAPNLLYSASLGGGRIPPEALVAASDFHLLHGNGQTADRVTEMVDVLRVSGAYVGGPVVFNEDSTNLANMRAAFERGASWGYYDQGANDYVRGFQSPPTNWAINTMEKVAFFTLVRDLTRPSSVD